MNNIIQNLDDITDSREMLEAKPHKFTVIFTYILLSLFSVTLVWSYFGKVDIVIGGSGVIKPINKITPVINEVDGKVTKINFRGGEAVKAGDILYELDSTEVINNKEKDDKSIVKAMSDGIISIKTDISEGKLLKKGDKVLEIMPENNSGYMVELHIANKDISHIEIGQEIKYHVDAFPYEEYGEMNGEVVEIADDSIVDEHIGTSYYLIKAIIKDKPLFSREGKEYKLKSGMTCEAYVINNQERILYYALEKVRLKN